MNMNEWTIKHIAPEWGGGWEIYFDGNASPELNSEDADAVLSLLEDVDRLRAENNKLRFLNAVAEKAFDEGGATLDRASDEIERLLAENAALRARIDDCAAALMADAEGR